MNSGVPKSIVSKSIGITDARIEVSQGHLFFFRKISQFGAERSHFIVESWESYATTQVYSDGFDINQPRYPSTNSKNCSVLGRYIHQILVFGLGTKPIRMHIAMHMVTWSALVAGRCRSCGGWCCFVVKSCLHKTVARSNQETSIAVQDYRKM